MGFLDKLKSIKNAVTGGGANVSIEIGEASLGETLSIKVKAVIDNADVKVEKVYVRIRSEEEVIIPDVPLAREEGEEGVVVERQSLVKETQTSEMEVKACGAETLEADQEYEWEVEVELPSNALPTYHGPNAKHDWYAFAGLAAFGNDPDSGWVVFEVE